MTPDPPATMTDMAKHTAASAYLIESMADTLIRERPDLREIIDQQVRDIKFALVEGYFSTAFEPEPAEQPELVDRKTFLTQEHSQHPAPTPKATEGEVKDGSL